MENQATFLEIYEKHKSLVFNVCLNYLQNQEDAEEVFQDVFLKVHQKIDKFEERSSLKTWIYRITINLCLDFIKAKKRKKRFAFLQSLSNQEIQIASPFSHPGVLLENKEGTEAIFKAINQLPESQKTALLLKSIEGLPQKEIASIMTLNEKAVESLLSRARKKMKELLNESKDN